MSREQAFIRIICDSCGNDTDIELLFLSEGLWDESEVDRELETLGWRKGEDIEEDICYECVFYELDDEENQ